MGIQPLPQILWRLIDPHAIIIIVLTGNYRLQKLFNRSQNRSNLPMCYTLLFYISFEICSRMDMRLMSRASIDRKACSIHQVIGRKVQLQGVLSMLCDKTYLSKIIIYQENNSRNGISNIKVLTLIKDWRFSIDIHSLYI